VEVPQNIGRWRNLLRGHLFQLLTTINVK
jgi:hypothetical protein